MINVAMRNYRVFAISLFVILAFLWVFVLSGCGQSATLAQESFDRGTTANNNVRNAFFVKGWGLNRALITEGREKLVAQSRLKLLAGESAEDVLTWLNSELGEDEVVRSEDFAYLSFLMLMGERSDDYMSNVDNFIESKKPIWKHLSKSAQKGVNDLAQEYKAWEPLIRQIGDKLKDLFGNVGQDSVQ